jgi:hypothetical protein
MGLLGVIDFYRYFHSDHNLRYPDDTFVALFVVNNIPSKDKPNDRRFFLSIHIDENIPAFV